MIRIHAELEQLEPGRFHGAYDDTWRQGPGVFGGLVAAAIGRSAERTIPERPLRAMSLQLMAPLLPQSFELHVTEERRGTYVSYASARILQEGRPAAIAQLTLGRERPVPGDFEHTQPPTYPPPDHLPDLGRPPGIPAFTQHFQMRFVKGVPFSGSERAETGGWVRPAASQALDTPLLLALLDTWPLGVLPRFAGPAPAASIAIQFVLFPRQVPADAWYRVAVEAEVQQGGYSGQSGRLWAPDGALLGLSHQLVMRLG